MKTETKLRTLAIEDLSIGYDRKQEKVIAEQLTFSCHQGELIAIVGANGIGKSTLLRTLSGMQTALDGNIAILETPMDQLNALEIASHISVVLTEPPASKNLYVSELIALGRQPYTNWMGRLSEKDHQAVELAMTQTETIDLAQRKCYELSDGQLQRVFLARALAQDTPIIILDEPTTHLDIYHQAYVFKLLKRLASEMGKTIVFATHDINLAIQLCDKMLVLTPETHHFDTPCRLIEQHCFDSLFPEDSIQFDTKTGRFNMKN